MKRPEVFYTCEWALAVQSAFRSAFRPSPRPLLCLGYDDDDLIGVASLALDLGEQNVSFLAGSTADYCDFLSHPRRRKEFVGAVLAELHKLKVSSLVLANLPQDSATSSALESAARKHGFYLYIRPAYVCPRIELGSGAHRQELYTKVSRKRQLRKCLRTLEREGPVTLKYLRSWTEIQPALPEFVAAHVARYRALQRVSILCAPERRFLLEELARRFSGTGIVTLTRLMVGEQPAAWSYGFQFNGSWFLYQTTFDMRWRDNSPGYCLLGKIVTAACETNTLNAIDLGLGTEDYKGWFASGARETLHATLTTSAVRHWREIARYRIASGVKEFPKLDAAIRSARSKLRL